MSTATAAADESAAPKQGKKKLIIIVVAAVLLLGAAGAGALIFLKKSQVAEEDDADAPSTAQAAAPSAPPIFVPLDPFTVNLADREAERYAQIGVTFAVEDSKVVDAMKVFMPAIRNNVLMVLAHKTSAELLQRDGKDKLAAEIQREASRALGYAVPDEDAAEEDDEDTPKKRKGKRKPKPAPLPIKSVYFSNFIVQ